MVLGDFANNILEKFTQHLQKPENKTWINTQILTPVATYIEGYLKPYFLTLLICLLAMVLLLLYNSRMIMKLQSQINQLTMNLGD